MSENPRLLKKLTEGLAQAKEKPIHLQPMKYFLVSPNQIGKHQLQAATALLPAWQTSAVSTSVTTVGSFIFFDFMVRLGPGHQRNHQILL